MRILHVLNHCRRQNGNVHVAVDLACAQVQEGHDVGYVSEGGDLAPVLQDNGVQLFDLDQTRSRATRAPAIALKLASIIRGYRADIVHAHMMTGAVTGYFATRLTGIPLVTHIHNSFEKHAILMRVGDRIIAVSRAVAEQAVKRGMSAKRVRVVENGTIGTARLSATPEAPADLARPSIGTVCGLHPRKGVDHLIDAFEIVAGARPDTHLYIVGDGPFRSDYEARAAKAKASSRIHFTGALPDPRPHLASFDVFALASLSDPCPLVIGEARWAGCAVVATNVDGIPETLDGGLAGRLTPPADPAAMAKELLAVLDGPASLAAAREAAHAGADRFKLGRVVAEVEHVYRELLGPSVSSPVSLVTA